MKIDPKPFYLGTSVDFKCFWIDWIRWRGGNKWEFGCYNCDVNAIIENPGPFQKACPRCGYKGVKADD